LVRNIIHVHSESISDQVYNDTDNRIIITLKQTCSLLVHNIYFTHNIEAYEVRSTR